MKKILSIIVLALTLIAGQANATSIAVNGKNPTEIYRGSVYKDDGATVTYNDGTTADVSGDTSKVNTNRNGTYAVDYSATDTDGSGETATAQRTVNVVGGSGAIIFKNPTITRYSVESIGANQYRIHLTGKNLPLRASSQIKLGKDLNEVSFADWQAYSEVITVNTDANKILIWVKNSTGTGKVKTIILK